MKKVFFTLILVSTSMVMLAQNPISFGPKVGFNTTTLSTDYTDYLDKIKSGGQAGLFFSINMEKFYIQPEAYFSLKRGELDTRIGDPTDPTGSLDISQSVSLKTVDIPLLLGYRLIDLKIARLRLWGGPVASYVLNKDYTLTINGIDKSSTITKEDFKDATWSVQLGAGLDVLMLTLDVGYHFGLDNFMTISSLDDFNLKNNVFFCSLGWRIY